MITVEELQHVNIFKGLPPEHLAPIIPSLTEKSYPAGETIIHRGDPGYSMFVILDGTVTVTLKNDEGIDYTINTQGKGENCGEMALMTGEPRSANVKALTQVRLAELSQEAFFGLIAAYPELVDGLLQQLAQRRAKTMVRQQFANMERAEIIANLFAQQPPEVDHFLGKTKWTNDLNASLERLASSQGHLLILGERGTGKDLAARLIHFRGPAKAKPLFHLDCANPPPIQRDSDMGKNEEKDLLHLELAQESALFGHGADAGSYARGIRRGYLELADGGTVVLENVDALSPHVQRRLVHYLQTGIFSRTGESRDITTRARLISTAAGSLQELKARGTLDPELLSLAGGEIVHLKPLRERKKDIPVIAQHLLQKYNQKFAKQVTGFTKEALNSLVDHDWPLNIDELHQVLERAVATTDGNTITERQVFLQVPSFSATGKVNLLKIPFVRELAGHRLMPRALRMVTVPFILGMMILTLAGPPANNPANLVAWAIWWPFLIFTVMVGSRSWCGYCPLPVISDGLNSFRRKVLPVPLLLEKYGPWIGIGGFALIILVEHSAHMVTAAHATGILLLCILAGTTITNFFFGRRSWCKHICPLGRMVAQCSTVSLMELGTNSNVCSSQCQTPDCVMDRNCPMGIHPSAASASKDCVLCLSCVKRCKHQSIRLDLRLPWHEFHVRERWNLMEAFFAVSLTALVLAVKLPQWGPLSMLMAQHLEGNQALAEIAVPVVIGAAFITLSLLASGLAATPSWRQNFTLAGPAYLFLAFAGYFNVYFHELIYSGPNLLPWTVQWLGLGHMIPAEWITPNLGTMKALVPLLTLGGAIISLSVLARLCRRHALPSFVRRAHKWLLLITTLAFVVIL